MKEDRNIPFVLPRSELSELERDDMFELLSGHFRGVTRERFEKDLAEKNWIILIRRGSRMVGFSTVLFYTSVFEERSVRVIYSGDTIMAREAWGSPALPRAWISTVNQLCGGEAGESCYWLLLTSGFRTYRFLPVFWREFSPHYALGTSAEQKRLLAHLARERFGNQFNPGAGIVRFHQPQRLCPELAELPAGRVTDPHVAHFLKCNPGHGEGDELVCLTELSTGNLTAAGRRMCRPDSHELVAGDR